MSNTQDKSKMGGTLVALGCPVAVKRGLDAWGSWALFVEQEPDVYVRLLASEDIPIQSHMAHAGDLPEVNRDELLFVDQGVPVIDMANYKHPHPVGDYDHLLKGEKFRLRFNFDRQYKIGVDKPYAVKLLALVAVVGG